MDALIIAVLTGTATRTQELELLRWRRASAQNESYYRDFAEVWALTGRAAPGAAPPPPSATRIIQRAESRAATSTRQVRRIPALAGRAAVAAAAVLLIAIGVSMLKPAPPSLANGVDEVVTGANETATVDLRDGTVIRLAPNSQLRLMGTLENREVSLSGRAYFAVAHHGERPFRIRTEAGDVTVLGTRFDLASQDDELRVVVVEGLVELSANGQRTRVGPDEMRDIREGDLLPAVHVSDVHAVVAWKGDFLAFQSTPLREAAREISRHFDVNVHIEDPGLLERTITTWLSDRTLEEVLRIVCAAVMAECTSDEGVVRIRDAVPGASRQSQKTPGRDSAAAFPSVVTDRQ